MARFDLTDLEWQLIQPLLPDTAGLERDFLSAQD